MVVESFKREYPAWFKKAALWSGGLLVAGVASIQVVSGLTGEDSIRDAYVNQYGECLSRSELAPEYIPDMTNKIDEYGNEYVQVTMRESTLLDLIDQPTPTLSFDIDRQSNDIDLTPRGKDTIVYVDRFDC